MTTDEDKRETYKNAIAIILEPELDDKGEFTGDVYRFLVEPHTSMLSEKDQDFLKHMAKLLIVSGDAMQNDPTLKNRLEYLVFERDREDMLKRSITNKSGNVLWLDFDTSCEGES